jgi:PAS domain S-box-containing protein
LRLSLAGRIVLGFGLTVAAFGGVTIYGVLRLYQLKEALAAVNQELLPLSQTITEIKTLEEVTRKTIDSILHIEDLARQKELLQRRRASFERSLDSLCQEMTLRVAGVERLPAISGAGAFFPRLRRELDEVRRLRASYDEALATLIDTIDPEQGLTADPAALAGWQKQSRSLSSVIRVLDIIIRGRSRATLLQMENQATVSSESVLWLSGLAVLLGALGAVLLLAALGPINRLMEAARRISRGDFSQQVEYRGRDELGQLAAEFNRMTQALAAREQQLLKQQQELERINRMLRQSSLDIDLMKRYHENIIRSIPAAVMVLDADRRITTVNPASRRIWGLVAEKCTGLRLEELPLAECFQPVVEGWQGVLRERNNLFFEAVQFPPPAGGRPLHVDLHVSPLVGGDGNVQGVLVVGEDVSEKVQTKQALIQSERLAAIGRMAAMVAHEIRNPLSSIALNTELLQEEMENRLPPGEHQVREILSGVAREVDRLTEITEEYLRFARLPKPHLRRQRLQDMVRELLRFVQPELRSRGIRVEDRLDDGLPELEVDEDQLRQAFLNLLRNAMDSMPRGGVITLSSRIEDGRVCLDFADTGHGISPENLTHLFEPFFSTRAEGTGLGLSLTQHIIAEHGGRIDCHSQPGSGTTFSVELPLPAPVASGDAGARQA